MHNLSRTRKSTSIRAKLTRSSTIVIILLVLLIELCVYFSATRLQIRDSIMLNTELVDTMGKSFDEMHVSFKHAINFVTMNTDFQNVLAGKDDIVWKYGEDNAKLKELLADRALLCDEMDDLYLFDKDEKLRTVLRKKYRQGEPYLLFPEIDVSWFPDSGKVTTKIINGKLVFMRAINSMENLGRIGYLMTVYDNTELLKRVSTVISNKHRFVIVFDQNDEVVVHNYDDDIQLQTMLQNVDFSELNNSQIITIPRIGKTLIAQYVSPYNNWRTVSAVAINQVTRSSDVILKIVLVLGILCIVAGIVVQWLLAQRIVGPLNAMVKTVQQADEGNYRNRMEIGTGDELDILAHSFNEMLSKTDTLVNQVLRNEIKYRDMQLMALQSQINPHLLYNTLECINWLAEFGRKEDIRCVTIALSNLMKSLAAGPKMVELKEELLYTEDFLLIYKVLLGDKLQYTIDTVDFNENISIPRLTIQPLVENAVLHGIKKSMTGGNINVNISSTEDGVLISVVDDGVGMAQEYVDAINAYATGESSNNMQQMGVGIRNVIDRLKLIYHDDATLIVNSSPDWGTVIDMHIPITNQEGDNETFHSDFR